MLGKKVSAPVAVVLEGDPAIAQDCNYQEYKEALFDEAKLKLVQGEEPTRFRIRQLSDEQKDAIAGLGIVRQQAKLAIRCALQAIDNYLVIKADGQQETMHVPEFENAGKLGRIVSDSWLSSMNLPSDHLLKLYIAIDYFSEAHAPLSKLSALPAGATG